MSFIEYTQNSNKTISELTDSIKDFHKLQLVDKFLVEKTAHPRKTQTEICNNLDISRSTLNRYVKDLGLKSLYRDGRSHKRLIPRGNSTQSGDKLKQIETKVELGEESDLNNCNNCERGFKTDRGLKTHERFCSSKFENIIDSKLAETK